MRGSLPGRTREGPEEAAGELLSQAGGAGKGFSRRPLSFLFRKIKTLGEDDPWLDDTAAWIERSRQLQKEKDLAEKRVSARGGWGRSLRASGSPTGW